MKKKRNGTWKQPVASVLGMGLVVGLTIVGTLAFMYTKSNTKTNVFTGTNDIKLYLEEPKYNLLEEKDGDGNVTKYVLKDSSKLDPREYVPGETYLKDPTLYNTTGKQIKKYKGEDGNTKTEEFAEEWVAMRVDYGMTNSSSSIASVTYDQITHDCTADSCYVGKESYDGCTVGLNEKGGIIETIEFDEEILGNNSVDKEGKWIRVPKSFYNENATYDIFVYKYKLKAQENFVENSITEPETEAKGKANETEKATAFNALTTTLYNLTESVGNTEGVRTSPLFSEIVIKDQEKLKTNGYEISSLEKFEIKLTGAAIKVMPTHGITQITQTNVLKDVDAQNPKTKDRLIVDDLVSLLVDKTN